MFFNKPKEPPVGEFLDSLRVKGRRPSTIKWYRRRLEQFQKWLESQSLRFDKLNQGDLDRYIVSLLERELSPHTIYGHKKLVRQFVRWSTRRGHLKNDPAGDWPVSQPRPPDPESKAVKLEDVEKLLDACRQSWPPRDARDAAIVHLLMSAGIRASELTGLRLSDVEIDGETVTLHILQGKGDKPRAAFSVGHGAAEALQAWLEVRPECKDDHLFLCGDERRGQDWHGFTYWGLRMMLKRLSKRAGTEVSAHGFRHGFAIAYLARAEGDLPSLCQLLGHSAITTTWRYYSRFSTKRLKAKAQQHAPGRILDGLLAA